MAFFCYSHVQVIVLNAIFSQDNVFGSGKRVNLAFNNSNYLTSYQFGFFNPYFTVDGVSQGYSLGYTKRNAAQINLANYSTNVMNAGINFGIPINEYDQLRVDMDVKHTTLSTTAYTTETIAKFINDSQGKAFLTFAPALSWSHDTLNRAIFPNQGWQQRFSTLATVPGSDLEYYKASYKHQMYFPVAKDFTFKLQGEAAYGNGYGNTKGLPFFENYFGGGTGSVRGFKNNTLGPRDYGSYIDPTTLLSTTMGYPIGGSTKVIGSAELFFPVPFMPDTKSVRLGTFFDAGAISKSFNVNDMKYSAGVSGEWMSPFGALSVSAAMPLNAHSSGKDSYGNAIGDQKQIFQFNFGQNF